MDVKTWKVKLVSPYPNGQGPVSDPWGTEGSPWATDGDGGRQKAEQEPYEYDSEDDQGRGPVIPVPPGLVVIFLCHAATRMRAMRVR